MKRAFWDQCKGEMKAGNLDTVPSGSAPQTKVGSKKSGREGDATLGAKKCLEEKFPDFSIWISV